METWYGRENSTAVTPLMMRGERCAAAEQASHEASAAPRLIPERPTASAVPAERCREELREKKSLGQTSAYLSVEQEGVPQALLPLTSLSRRAVPFNPRSSTLVPGSPSSKLAPRRLRQHPHRLLGASPVLLLIGPHDLPQQDA